MSNKIALLNKVPARLIGAAFVVMTLTFASCSTISSFDQYAYAQTTSVKVDALNVMDLATQNYDTNKVAVQELKTKLQKVYEYEKNRPKNEITVKLWDKLLDPEGHLLGGFLVRWETEKKLGKVFISEEKKLVASAFDQISGLESKKIKPSEIK